MSEKTTNYRWNMIREALGTKRMNKAANHIWCTHSRQTTTASTTLFLMNFKLFRFCCRNSFLATQKKTISNNFREFLCLLRAAMVCVRKKFYEMLSRPNMVAMNSLVMFMSMLFCLFHESSFVILFMNCVSVFAFYRNFFANSFSHENNHQPATVRPLPSLDCFFALLHRVSFYDRTQMTFVNGFFPSSVRPFCLLNGVAQFYRVATAATGKREEESRICFIENSLITNESNCFFLGLQRPTICRSHHQCKRQTV